MNFVQAAGERTMDAEQQSILEAAEKFLWSAELQGRVEAFAVEHADAFAGANGLKGEQRLEWEGIHRAFRELYEEQLETFLSSHSVSMEAFAAACQSALTASEWQQKRGFVEVLVAMGEYVGVQGSNPSRPEVEWATAEERRRRGGAGDGGVCETTIVYVRWVAAEVRMREGGACHGGAWESGLEVG